MLLGDFSYTKDFNPEPDYIQNPETGKMEGSKPKNKEQKPVGGTNEPICKIDKSIYSCINPDIDSDEVVMPGDRVDHADESHPGDFEEIREFIPGTLEDPDIIFEGNKRNTGIVVKQITEEGRHAHVVLRVHVSTDPKGGSNSVRSAWKIGNKTLKRLKASKKILYEKK